MSDVEPEWDSGVPLHDDACRSYDGKRCSMMGFRPDRICELAVKEMATQLEEDRSGKKVDSELLTGDRKDRLARAMKWAAGEWVRLREDRPPLRYGRYELMSDSRYIVDFHRPSSMGYGIMCDVTGSHQSWQSVL